MDWNDLKQLVDSWHKSARNIPGYEDTEPDGDGVELMLFIQKTQAGSIGLRVVATKDWLSTVLPMAPGAMKRFVEAYESGDLDKPTIPYASMEVGPA